MKTFFSVTGVTLSFIFTILTASLKAQWYQHYPYPTNDDLNKIQFVSNTTGWILGSNTIFKTTDGGNSWLQQNIEYCNKYINLYFADSLHGWFVDNYISYPYYYPEIYKTNNGGNTWTFLKRFAGSELEQTDKSIFFIDSLNGWLTNYSNIIYTTDGGYSWLSPQMNSNVVGITDVFFYNSMLGWAITFYGDIINSVDGGHTWNLQNSETENRLNSIEFIDEYHGFIIGSSPPVVPSGSSSVFLETSDGGLTWGFHRVDSSYYCSLYSISRLDSENYIAVGTTTNTYGSNISYIYNSTNSGINWTKTEVEHYYYGSSAVNDQIIFIAGTKGKIKKSTNGGAIWEWVSKNLILDYPFLSVYFLNVNDGWITAENGSILHTNNGGETWYYQSSGTTNRLEDIMFANSSLGWAVGNNTILKTTNKGEDWVLINPGFGYHSYLDVFCMDNYCWIQNGNDIIRSTNGGASWDQTFLGSSSVWFISTTIGWAVGSYGSIYKTEDGGATWSPQNSGTNRGLSRVCFISENLGWAYGCEQGTYHVLLKTTNGGETWETIWDHVEVIFIRSLIFQDSLNGWMAGSYDNILRTTDGGYTWDDEEVTFCLPNWYASLCFTPSNTGWIVGGDGLILSTKIPVTGIEIRNNENVITTYTLSQNYPNPFNPTTKIRYQLPELRKVKLIVYDILGRKIKTLVNEEKSAGSYEVEFNGESLPSGVYFYRIEMGKFSDTKKFVLLK